MYDTLENEFVLENSGSVVRSTIFATVAYIDLMRIAGGVLDGKVIHLEKIKLLDELLLGDLKDQQSVIICRFTDEIDFVHKYLQSQKLKAAKLHGKVSSIEEREKIISNFMKKKVMYLVAQASLLSHGVDLSSSTNMIVYSQPNGPELRKQVEDRIITLNDDKDVLIIDLLIEKSVDEDLYDSYMGNERMRQTFDRAVIRCQTKQHT